MATKILIIKLGYSETLDSEIGKVPSLGDVLRTTPILSALKERFPDSQITWLVAEAATPLLQGNKQIDRILVWDLFTPFQLMKERFDVLINLEKIPGVCALADMVDAWMKYGFRFESSTGSFHGYENGLNFLDYIKGKSVNGSCTIWQKTLVEMLNVEWKEQELQLGYQPKTQVTKNIGLNYMVGSKWPSKSMPMDKWNQLESRLAANGYTTSKQQGLDNLFEYIDWINSNQLLITQDSLGLHIALALKKPVIALFGPTSSQEIYLYGRGVIITPNTDCPALPCYKPTCLHTSFCMDLVDIDAIVNAVHHYSPSQSRS